MLGRASNVAQLSKRVVKDEWTIEEQEEDLEDDEIEEGEKNVSKSAHRCSMIKHYSK